MQQNIIISKQTAHLRRFNGLGGLLATGATILISGCATPVVQVQSSPAGASVMVAGKPLGATPTQWQLEGDPQKPIEVNYSLTGYFPESFIYTPGKKPEPIVATLKPSRLKKTFEVTTEPAGASVSIEGTPAGVTPLTVPLEFVRATKTQDWESQHLTLSKTDYQSETILLTDNVASVPPIRLSLLKDQRTFVISAANLDGAELNADIALDGKSVGKTPQKITLTFQRSAKQDAWPTFGLKVDDRGKYKPALVNLSYSGNTAIALKLEAITEVPVVIYSPEVVMSPVGAVFKLIERSTLATLRTSDDSSAFSDLKQITKLDRQDMKAANRVETIAGYAITPDGQNVIFSLCEADETGNRSSTLYIKRSDDPSGGLSRLTQGSRYFDTQPFIANDGGNYLVFTSNRGDRTKPDIFRVNLIENRLSGGISRLTNDNRFNSSPSYGDSNRQLYYVSIEQAFPKAEPQISSIRFDGSLPTQLPVTGEQICNNNADKIYFVRQDSDTGKQQIYSITADGKLETALINQEDFRKVNCIQPSVSPDGTRILFASDHTSSTKDRPQNDIYAINADGSNLQRLTSNESDDTLPVWSPTEEGVVYFRSTRGGATNIWRFKLSGGR